MSKQALFPVADYTVKRPVSDDPVTWYYCSSVAGCYWRGSRKKYEWCPVCTSATYTRKVKM